MKYLVEALAVYQEKNITDTLLGYIPEEGERFEVDEDRLRILLGENKNNIVFVKFITHIENDSEDTTPEKDDSEDTNPEKDDSEDTTPEKDDSENTDKTKYKNNNKKYTKRK